MEASQQEHRTKTNAARIKEKYNVFVKTSVRRSFFGHDRLPLAASSVPSTNPPEEKNERGRNPAE
jgi:hypothetical protein